MIFDVGDQLLLLREQSQTERRRADRHHRMRLVFTLAFGDLAQQPVVIDRTDLAPGDAVLHQGRRRRYVHDESEPRDAHLVSVVEGRAQRRGFMGVGHDRIRLLRHDGSRALHHLLRVEIRIADDDVEVEHLAD